MNSCTRDKGLEHCEHYAHGGVCCDCGLANPEKVEYRPHPDDIKFAQEWLISPEIFTMRWKNAGPESGMDSEGKLVALLLAFAHHLCPFALTESK